MLRETDEFKAFKYKHIAKVDKNDKNTINKFCEMYKDFIEKSKTERECTKNIIEMAKGYGYKEFTKENVKDLKPNDKYYFNNRGKSCILFTVGKKPLDSGINFVVSHIDSPRLDLKPIPLYEESDIAYLKTHYYGGIRKYQWATIPLSMHGVMYKENGDSIEFCIGEKEEDEKFYITDLLPHLVREADEKNQTDFNPELLNVVVGSMPLLDGTTEKEKGLVKKNILNILYNRYNIIEKDFVRAEIEFVPSFHPSDIGFDRSMIAAYGQDDRVCAFPALMSELENKDKDLCSMAVFTDKEEIGSEGNTGMVSSYLFDFVEDLADIVGVKTRDIYRHSLCFSSDVNSAFDPSFADVFEKRNSSFINHGVVVTKYTGHRGKSGSNDASAETMAKVVKLLDSKDVYWQTGELGKVDIGGGGTIAMYMSERNIDTVDIGVAVLSMHAPYELTSKMDIYHTYLAYKAFLYNV